MKGNFSRSKKWQLRGSASAEKRDNTGAAECVNCPVKLSVCPVKLSVLIIYACVRMPIVDRGHNTDRLIIPDNYHFGSLCPVVKGQQKEEHNRNQE